MKKMKKTVLCMLFFSTIAPVSAMEDERESIKLLNIIKNQSDGNNFKKRASDFFNIFKENVKYVKENAHEDVLFYGNILLQETMSKNLEEFAGPFINQLDQLKENRNHTLRKIHKECNIFDGPHNEFREQHNVFTRDDFRDLKPWQIIATKDWIKGPLVLALQALLESEKTEITVLEGDKLNKIDQEICKCQKFYKKWGNRYRQGGFINNLESAQFLSQDGSLVFPGSLKVAGNEFNGVDPQRSIAPVNTEAVPCNLHIHENVYYQDRDDMEDGEDEGGEGGEDEGDQRLSSAVVNSSDDKIDFFDKDGLMLLLELKKTQSKTNEPTERLMLLMKCFEEFEHLQNGAYSLEKINEELQALIKENAAINKRFPAGKTDSLLGKRSPMQGVQYIGDVKRKRIE
jgi:hypothetical protein